MTITWYGQSCFKLKNNKQTVLIDPYSPRKYGLRGPNLKADIMVFTNSEDEKKIKQNFKNECFVISSPGEYEIKNIFINGVSFIRENKQLTIYQLEMEGIRFGILGEISDLLNNEELDGLNGIDVLFVPVGGKDMVDSKSAIEIINLFEPRLAIPCCFKVPGLKYNLSTLGGFLKDAGIKDIEKLKKLSLQKKHLLEEQTKFISLELGG